MLSKIDIKRKFESFEKIAKSNISLQAKVDQLNIEMLRILKDRTN